MSESHAMIVLITDFGPSSPYVAEMKAAIWSVFDRVRIVDGTHAVPPQDVVQGAFVTKQLADAFPQGTSFVVVVDPGVGTERRILLVEYHKRNFIAPDNGVLTPLLDDAEVHVVDKPQFWREKVSSTFHGRDVMGPVAAHLAAAVPRELMASRSDEALRLDSFAVNPRGHEVEGQVVHVDSFGNIITNIQIDDSWIDGVAEFAGQRWPLERTYGSAVSGTSMALVGSSGYLEFAVVNGNASQYFQAKIGDSVRYRWE